MVEFIADRLVLTSIVSVVIITIIVVAIILSGGETDEQWADDFTYDEDEDVI